MPTILETANKAGAFTVFTQALRASGLKPALTGPGPFTVFAPDDKAFRKLPQDKLNHLLRNRDQLASVIKHHIVAGRYTSSDLHARQSLKTTQGQELSIRSGDWLQVGDASVVKADIETANGIIHVVDTVLRPSARSDR